MSRISCNVTKDLLPSYLDEICSEESRGLVEEHLRECASCKEFLAKLQNQDMGNETSKIDYLKKVRRSMDTLWLVAVGASLALLLVGMSYGNSNGAFSGTAYYYFIEMPLLMLLYAFLFNRGKKIALPAKAEWLIPICGAGAICGTVVLEYVSIDWMAAEAPLPVPLSEIGSYIHRLALLPACTATALLIVIVGFSMKKDRAFPISQNVAWLGLNLAMSFDSLLHNMSDLGTLTSTMIRSAAVLTAEFAVITAGILMICHKKSFREPENL